jgi:hypothetical protein
MFVISTIAPESKQESTFENLEFRNRISLETSGVRNKSKIVYMMTLVGLKPVELEIF